MWFRPAFTLQAWLFCSDRICFSWAFTFMITSDLYLSLMRTHLFSKTTCVHMLALFGDLESSASPRTKSIFVRRLMVLKPKNMEVLVANVYIECCYGGGILHHCCFAMLLVLVDCSSTQYTHIGEKPHIWTFLFMLIGHISSTTHTTTQIWFDKIEFLCPHRPEKIRSIS